MYLKYRGSCNIQSVHFIIGQHFPNYNLTMHFILAIIESLKGFLHRFKFLYYTDPK